MKSLSPWQLPADPAQPLESATKQYVDNVSIAYAGNVSGNWVPPATLARQVKAIVTGALAVQSPTAGLVDGYVLTLVLWSTSASQVVTIDGAITNVGFPTSFQLTPNKLGFVLLRYSVDFNRWTCISIEQEL